MQLAANTVLITGGASGIGLALAERFLAAGSKLLLCGRREERLREVKEKHAGVRYRVCDVSDESERVALVEWAAREDPAWNVLVNNAGIQRRDPIRGVPDWKDVREEIAVNLEAPIHLSMLAIPHLTQQRRPSIVNITSGLAFSPLSRAAVYSATKAALHSFTLSLRHQLSGTPIEVIEVIPPAVNTDLGGAGLHTFGVSAAEFLDAVIPRIEAGDLEVAYGFAKQSSRASRDELDAAFRRMNAPEG